MKISFPARISLVQEKPFLNLVALSALHTTAIAMKSNYKNQPLF
jgi:hypothetical protein